MGNEKLKTAYLTKVWIFINLTISLVYFLVWLSSIFYSNLYSKLDVIFGFFPNLFDKIYYNQIYINNTEVSFGYIFVSVFFILFLFVPFVLKKILFNLLNSIKKNKDTKNLKKEKSYSKKNLAHPVIPFFGLFEMNFEFLNSLDRINNDLEKLKKEYFKILVNKLKEKHPNVQFIATNKVFIISNEFENFDELLSDIIRIFAIFQKLNNEKYIGTNFLLSFEMGTANTEHKKIYRLLSKINDLMHYNQVIVLEKFVKKYKYVLEKKFLSNALGSAEIISDDFGEINVDLCYLEMIN